MENTIGGLTGEWVIKKGKMTFGKFWEIGVLGTHGQQIVSFSIAIDIGINKRLRLDTSF